MKCNEGKPILISIHPEYVQKIFSGEKKVEFRRNLPETAFYWRKMAIYETSPVRKITGVASIAVWRGLLKATWEDWGRSKGGISREKYYRYFDGCSKVWFIEICHVAKIAPGVGLDVLGLKFPPQSWRYIHDDDFNKLLNIIGGIAW